MTDIQNSRVHVAGRPDAVLDARTTRRRTLVLLAVSVVALVVAHLADPWAYTALAWSRPAERDWGRLLRVMGYLPTWLVIALAFWIEGRNRTPNAAAELRDAARAILVATIIGGIVAELLKLLIRRERPGPTAGISYSFRPFSERPFYSGDLGLPSSHVMVAFAGAGALNRRFPRAGPIVLALAAGCGLTRLFSQAHFLSDAVAGALGGWWIGALISGRRTSATARLPETRPPG